MSEPGSIDPLTAAIQQVEDPSVYKTLALCASPHSLPESSRPAPEGGTWRHPAELDYIGPKHPSAGMWSDYSIITYLVRTAISIPPRSDSRSDPWVVVTNDGGNTTLPRGYRVPLLWLAKVQWETTKLLLTKGRPLWDHLKFDILHLARLTTQFLSKARSEARIKRQWRDITFDRVITRFFNGWMGCRDVFVSDFYQEFKDEEYKDDVLARRWAQKVPKGIQGFVVTEQELIDGITSVQFMSGLEVNSGDLTFTWAVEPEVEHPPAEPPISPARRKEDEDAAGMNSRGSSPLTSEMGSDIEMIAESLNPKASQPSTPGPTPTPTQKPHVPLAIQTGPELQRKKSKTKPRPKTDRLEKANRPIRTRTMSGSMSALSPATPKIAHLSRPEMSISVPGSSTSSPNRTPIGFDFTAPVESRGRKRKIESIYSISPSPPSPLTSDSEDDASASAKGSREPKNPSRPLPRPVNATPDGRAFSTNSRIVIPRLSNPEVYSKPTTEVYPSAPTELSQPVIKAVRKPSASESLSPRKQLKPPIVPLSHYKLYAISSSPSTNPFDPQNPATLIPPFSTWRHHDELEYIGPNHPKAAEWTDLAIVTYMVDNVFTIPSRNADNKQTWVEVKVSNPDGTTTSTTLPRGYRIPLLWLGRVQWDCLKLLLTSGREYWESLRFDILHITRLSVEFLAKARREVKIKRQYRDAMFDRPLTRFFNGWMGSRDEFVWDFYREFRDEEYEDDMLQRRWLQKAVKGIQGFAVTETELNEGITAEQLMQGLHLDREKGTFEWIDPNAPAPVAVASTSGLPAAAPAIEPVPYTPVEPSPLRIEVSQQTMHSPLSLSQVAGVHSRSPSPLTPDFGLDNEMDVDPPAPAEPMAATSAASVATSDAQPERATDPQPEPATAAQNVTVIDEAEPLMVQEPVLDAMQPAPTVDAAQSAPTVDATQPASSVDFMQSPSIVDTIQSASVDIVQPVDAMQPAPTVDIVQPASSVDIMQPDDSMRPSTTLDAMQPTPIVDAPDSTRSLPANGPASSAAVTATVEAGPAEVDNGPAPPPSPLPRWTSPLRSATPSALDVKEGGDANEAVRMDVTDGSTPRPEPDLEMDTTEDVHVYDADGDADGSIEGMDNINDLDDLDADFLRYPSSPSGSPSAPGPIVDSTMQDPSTLLLYPPPSDNNALAPRQPEEEEVEFDETDYIRSRLPSPFVMTPTAQPLELESPKPSAKSPSSDPPAEPIPAPLPPRSESSESIRSSSSPEPRLPEPEPEVDVQDPVLTELSTEERLPSPPPDSDEEEIPAQELAQEAVPEPEAEEAPVAETSEAAPITTAEEEAPAPVAVAHILPLSPADAIDEFPPGFHFIGIPQGAPSHSSSNSRPLFSDRPFQDETAAVHSHVQSSIRNNADSASSEGVQVRPTANASRAASVNARPDSPIAGGDALPRPPSLPASPTAETVMSALPRAGDSKRVKLEIMTVSLSKGPGEEGVEGETDMDIETPIDVDMEDGIPSSPPGQPLSSPLGPSQSLFTPDATPRSVAVAASAAAPSNQSHAAAAVAPPNIFSPSPASAVPASVSNQSNDYMVAPGLSSIGNRSSPIAPRENLNIFGRHPLPSRPTPPSVSHPPPRFVSEKNPAPPAQNVPPLNGATEPSTRSFMNGGHRAGTLFLRDKPPAPPPPPPPHRMDVAMDGSGGHFRSPIRIPTDDPRPAVDEYDPRRQEPRPFTDAYGYDPRRQERRSTAEEYDPRRQERRSSADEYDPRRQEQRSSVDEYDPRRQNPIILGPSSSFSIPGVAAAHPTYPRWMGYSNQNGAVPILGGAHQPYSPLVSLNRMQPQALSTPPSPRVPIHPNGAGSEPARPPSRQIHSPIVVEPVVVRPPSRQVHIPAMEPVVVRPPSRPVGYVPEIEMSNVQHMTVPLHSPSPLPPINKGPVQAPSRRRTPTFVPSVNGSSFGPIVAHQVPLQINHAREIAPSQINHTPEIEMGSGDMTNSRSRSPPRASTIGTAVQILPNSSSAAVPAPIPSVPVPVVADSAPSQVRRAPEIDMRSLENSLIARLKEELKSQLRDELKGELKDELKNELKDDVLVRLRAELPGQMKQELLGQLREELFVQMKEDLLLQLKDELLVQLKVELLTQLKAELIAQLKDELLLQLKDQLLLQLQEELLGLLKDELKSQLTDDLTVALKNDLRQQLRADLKGDLVLDLQDHFTSQLRDQVKLLLVQLKETVNSQLRDEMVVQLKYFVAKLKEELIGHLKDTLTVHLKDGLITQVKAALTAQLRDGLGAQREQLNLDFERRRLFLEQQPRVRGTKPASPAVSTPSRPTPTTPRPLPSLLFQARHPLHHLVLSTTPPDSVGMDVDTPNPPPTPPVPVSPSKPKGTDTPLPVKSQRKQSWFTAGYQAS
ncbi:hypothetical protein C8R43DRAFT_1014699 [Mycena crocata]|nr:hypothetical protein C8R43DRAFT_1014699 [Mycena crocata]